MSTCIINEIQIRNEIKPYEGNINNYLNVKPGTGLVTPFPYGILGYTRIDWYEYLAPTVPGD
jgi:hypothetical protein